MVARAASTLVEDVVDAAVGEGVLWLKLVVVLGAVFACRRAAAVVSIHDLLPR